jgi:hypothetical protein
MVINNAPTGAAVDIGACLAGDTDCMLSFDAVQSKAAPLNLGLCLNIQDKITAADAAKGIANTFAALQSLAITRPVTVAPFVQCFASKKSVTVRIELESITLSDTLDFTKLALMSDPRTLRQFICNAYNDSKLFSPTNGIPMDTAKNSAALTVATDGAPTTYLQASERIKQLLEAQNG